MVLAPKHARERIASDTAPERAREGDRVIGGRVPTMYLPLFVLLASAERGAVGS